MPFQSKAKSVTIVLSIVLAVFIGPLQASERPGLWDKWCAVLTGQAPHEQALGLYLGTAYDWSDMQFLLASWQSLYDYETIWPHAAPDALGIRFEGNLGTATGTEFSGARLVGSGNVLAVYNLETWRTSKFVPYVEAGIGLIYTDFQRDGQGQRLNFNPVAGVGARMGSAFLTLRLHHVSNGGLDDDNHGINSVVLGFGMYL